MTHAPETKWLCLEPSALNNAHVFDFGTVGQVYTLLRDDGISLQFEELRGKTPRTRETHSRCSAQRFVQVFNNVEQQEVIEEAKSWL